MDIYGILSCPFFSSFVLDVNIPAIHNKMTVNFLDYPYLLILALTVTLGIIFISSQIEKWGGWKNNCLYG